MNYLGSTLTENGPICGTYDTPSRTQGIPPLHGGTQLHSSSNHTVDNREGAIGQMVYRGADSSMNLLVCRWAAFLSLI